MRSTPSIACTSRTRIQLDGANASREAAAAPAAHDVLVAILPSQSATYDAALAATLSRLSADAARHGASIGAAAARALLDLRADDGWNRVPANANARAVSRPRQHGRLHAAGRLRRRQLFARKIPGAIGSLYSSGA